MAEVLFNPFVEGYLENPYEQFEALRDHDPVHETPFGAFYVSRYDDVVGLLRDPALSVDPANANATPMAEMAAELIPDLEEGPERRNSMLDRDPPDHTRLRKLVSRVFTPRRIAELEPRIQELVDAKLDKAAADGGFELVGSLAFPLPFEVISEMLGMPDTDRDQVRDWSGTVVRSLEPINSPDVLLAIFDAANNLRALLTDVIAWKRANPDDLLLSRLIQAEEDGDVLSDDELIAQLSLLFIAGHETTVNLIGNGALALLRNPDQLAALRADPTLIDNAVEEFLRYDAPVQMTRRITKADHEVRGVAIPKGTFVVCALAAANRDPRHFGDDAHRLDLARPAAREHLAFGGGAHYCLGAALARLEARTALGSLVRRFPALDLAGEPVYNGRINLRGLDELAVSV